MEAVTKAKRARDVYKAAREDSEELALPKKKFYRQRAHANPFSDHALT
jgi:tRNA (guanine-N7-)-methyltransferase